MLSHEATNTKNEMFRLKRNGEKNASIFFVCNIETEWDEKHISFVVHCGGNETNEKMERKKWNNIRTTKHRKWNRVINLFQFLSCTRTCSHFPRINISPPQSIAACKSLLNMVCSDDCLSIEFMSQSVHLFFSRFFLDSSQALFLLHSLLRSICWRLLSSWEAFSSEFAQSARYMLSRICVCEGLLLYVARIEYLKRCLFFFHPRIKCNRIDRCVGAFCDCFIA